MTQVFAQVGQPLQVIGGECPEGFIEMVGQRPGLYNNAQPDGSWGPEAPPAITCSKRQGELALLELDSPTPEHPSLLHWVEAAIEATADPIEKRKMQAYFNAAEWHTDDPFVTQMWQAAGRDLTELPAVFQAAALR